MVEGGGPPLTADEIPAWTGISEELEPFANLRRNLGYARRLATAGQHLSKLELGAFEVSDVYRAAWVQAISALDHWVGEEVRARMKRLAHPLSGIKPAGFSTFTIPLAQLERFLNAPASLVDILEEEFFRTRGHLSYQNPEKIKAEFKLISDVKDLWTEVAKVLSGRAGDSTALNAQIVKERLGEIALRRHKIVNESDVHPRNPLVRRPIDGADTTETIDWIEQLAAAIIEVLDGAE